jgi:hypothetical protein
MLRRRERSGIESYARRSRISLSENEVMSTGGLVDELLTTLDRSAQSAPSRA